MTKGALSAHRVDRPVTVEPRIAATTVQEARLSQAYCSS
jgi:hypothetical protein